MRFSPHAFQAAAVDYASARLDRSEPRTCIASPTGTGKGVMELMLLQRRPNAALLTPSLGIIAGLLHKAGHDDAYSLSESALFLLAERHRIFTPGRFVNRLSSGSDWAPSELIFDEGHHAEAQTWLNAEALCGNPPSVCLTATPFRGSPKGTADFLKKWGEPVWAITIKDAAARGFLAFPECRTLALVDDDEVEVRNGEFVASQVSSKYASRLEDAAAFAVREWWRDGRWDRATTATLPNRELCLLFAGLIEKSGAGAVVVTAETGWRERAAYFESAVAGNAILVQVRVVGEGVDLPLRRLFDLAPCVSPVRWMQLLGRIERPLPPGEAPPEYWCTNRNLLRHAYLLEGMVPASAVKEAEAAFKGPGKRAAARVLGLEAIGRFRAAELPLADGTTGLMYVVVAPEGAGFREYAAIVSPTREDPIWATRAHPGLQALKDGARARWRRTRAPEGLEGFASAASGGMTENMAKWWEKSAAGRGLDASKKPSRRAFCALPILMDLGERL